MSALREFWTNVVGPAPGVLKPAGLKQNSEANLADESVAFPGDPDVPVLHPAPVARAGPGPIARPDPSKSPPPTGAGSVPEEQLDATILEMDNMPELTNKARVKELVQQILQLLEQELAKPAVQQRISELKKEVQTSDCFGRDDAIKATKRIILEQLYRLTKQMQASESPTDKDKADEFNRKIRNSVFATMVVTKLVKERLEQRARDILGDTDTLDPAELDQAKPQDRRDRLIAELRRIPQDIAYVQERIKALEKERTQCEEQAAQLTETYARTKDDRTGKTLSETKQRIKKINDDIKDSKDEAERAFPAKEKNLLREIAKEPSVSRKGHVSLLERWLIQRYQNTHPELWYRGRVE